MKLQFLSYILVGVALLCGTLYYYYNDTQNTIQTLAANSATYENASKTANETIKSIQDSIKDQQDLIKDLSQKINESEKNTDKLRNIIQSHDLQLLALKKPGLIERRINDATKKVFDEVDDITDY